MAKQTTEDKRRVLPEGRLINSSFFEKDTYTDAKGREAVPSYKFEVAIDPEAVFGEGNFEDLVWDAVAEECGEDAAQGIYDYTEAYENEERPVGIKWFLDGDVLAEKREKKGKPGDAYKGKVVFRGKTIYNRNGDDAPGGIRVYDLDLSEITVANKDEIYNGCMGQVGVTINVYEDDDGQPAVSYYLVAFQKTGDAERLTTPQDHSTLFKPIGKKAGGRRTRKG